jgi:hypothetical protein
MAVVIISLAITFDWSDIFLLQSRDVRGRLVFLLMEYDQRVIIKFLMD